MAEQTINVADKETLDIVNSKIDTLDSVADNIYSKVDAEVANILTDIGATNATGGSTTAGTVMGKLNKIISDLATHMGRWTNTRAGYIDAINTNASNLNSRLTSARAGYLDKLNSGVPVSTLNGKIIKSVQRGVYPLGCLLAMQVVVGQQHCLRQ